MLAGEEQIGLGDAFEARDRRELAGQVAGVAAGRQRIRRPMLEVRHDIAADPSRRGVCAGKHEVQIREKPIRFELHGARIE